jgi:hypothetical protein
MASTWNWKRCGQVAVINVLAIVMFFVAMVLLVAVMALGIVGVMVVLVLVYTGRISIGLRQDDYDDAPLGWRDSVPCKRNAVGA